MSALRRYRKWIPASITSGLLLLAVCGFIFYAGGTFAATPPRATRTPSPVPDTIIQLVRAHVSLSADGTFALATAGLDARDVAFLHDTFDPLNRQLHAHALPDRIKLHGTPQPHAQSAGGAELALQFALWCWWAYVPNWALDTFAWIVIIDGGATAAVGGFVDATVLGIPLGGVLNALGIGTGVSGSWLLWYFDKYYPNGKWLCV